MQPQKAHHRQQRKIPALHPKPSFNQLYIRGNRPVPVYLKHAAKVLTKHNVIIIHALTAAINKAVLIALKLMEQYPYLQQKIYTDSVPTLNYILKGKQPIRGKQLKQQNECQKQNKIKQEAQIYDKCEQEQEQVIKQRAAIHIVLTKILRQKKQ